MKPNERKIKNKSVGGHCNVPVVITTCIIMLILIAIITTVTLVCTKNAEIARINSQQLQAETAQVEEVKKYSIYMILNELNARTDTNLAGNKITIKPKSEGLTIKLYNIKNNDPITEGTEEGIEVPEEGIKLHIEGIEEGKSYDIEIENKETPENYEQTFKKATITVDAQEQGELEAYVKEITKDNEVESLDHPEPTETTTEGSEEKVAIFAYEEEADGKIKIKGNKDVEIYYAIVYNDAVATTSTMTDERDETNAPEELEWQLYNEEEGIKLEKNGKLYSKSKYKDGGYSSINTLTINNIDKLKPSITVEDPQLNDAKDEVTVSISMQDQEETQEYGKSGVYGYAITTTEQEPTDFVPVNDEEENDVEADVESSTSSIQEPIATEIGGITKNGTYYAWVSDKAGNTDHKEITVTGIQEAEKHIVAIILSAPEKANDLIGKEYYTLQELMEALEEKEVTAEEDEQVVVQMVADVANDSTKISNKNILLDLNGYTITSKLQEPTIKVESGNLNIVDDKYDMTEYIKDQEKLQALQARNYTSKTEGDESTPCTGTVNSVNFVGIQVEEGGTVTLGKDGELLTEVPDKEAPLIKGRLKGVLNNGGAFNFYDGQIQGKVPVQGEITDKPIIYDPTLTELEGEKGIFKNILQKVAGIEALIGRTRYVKLENAIEKATNQEEATQIDIITEIAKDESITVDSTKNVKLNLNGYNLTNTIQDYVIKNQGKLEIIDTSITGEETTGGQIVSSTHNTIHNEQGAELKLTGGTITNQSKTAIKNEGTFELNGGNVKTTSTSSSVCGIENINEGEITITSGNISVGYYGIYHKGTETVTMTGGTISSTNGYGILNYSTGNVTMQAGTINGSSGIDNVGAGTVTIQGGEINTTKTAVYNMSNNINQKGTIIINGGTISSTDSRTYTVSNYYGTITIDEADITSTYYGIYNNSSGNMKITDTTISGGSSGIYNNGTIEVEGGSISETRKGVYNSGTDSKTTIKGTTITATERGIDNSDRATSGGEVTLEDVNINVTNGSDAYGIYNYGIGTINLRSGTIKVDTTSTSWSAYGVYNNSTGTINIGEKNEEQEYLEVALVSEDVHDNSINITASVTTTAGKASSAKSYGVYNPSGTLNFYKGTIVGGTEAIQGTINEVKEGYNIELGDIEKGEQATLEHQTGIAYIEGNQDELYDDLQSAINACSTEQKTIVLAKNSTMIVGKTIAENQNITLSLNGKSIKTYATDSAITNNGQLTIKDETEEGQISGYSSTILNNEANGTLRIESSSIIANGMNATCITNKGTIETEGGKLSSTALTNTSYTYGINNIDNGNVTINNISISACTYGIYNTGTENITIKNGTIDGTGGSGTIYGIYNEGTGNIIIQGGTISNYKYGIYNKVTGEIKVEGGNVSSIPGSDVYGIYNKGEGTIIVTNGNIKVTGYNVGWGSAYGYVIYNEGTGSAILKGGTITAEGSGYRYGIYNKGTGTITIESGDIKCSEISNSGTMSMTGGTITGGISNSGTVTITGGSISGSSYGIKNSNATGKITLGEKNGEVNTDAPVIECTSSGSYGIDNSQNGIFNFYDGRIIGRENKSINGAVSDKEEEYSIVKYTHEQAGKYEVEEGKEISVLEVVNVAKVSSSTIEDTEYTSLPKALEAITGEEETTITLLANVSIGENIEPLEIENGKNIILDLAGYTITASNENVIENNGHLTVKDSSKIETEVGTGTIIGSKGAIILNNESGTLKIESGIITLTSEGKAIENNGELQTTGGTINLTNSATNGQYSYGIYNKGNSSITSTTINGTGTRGYYCGIWNEENGSMTVKEGNISLKVGGNAAYGIYHNGANDITIENEEVFSQAYDAYGIYNNGAGKIIVNGGNINAVKRSNFGSYGIYNNSTGDIEINNEAKIGNSSNKLYYGIYNNEAGNIVIKNGEIVASTGIENVSGGSITIENGKISGDYYGIYNRGIGNISITGGTITANQSSSSCYAIYNSSSGTITIEEGEIKAVSNSLSYGINNTEGGTIIIKGGTITSEMTNTSATSTSIVSYGIYNNKGNIQIEGGKISGKSTKTDLKSCGIYNNIGTIEIGKKNEEIDELNITGGTTGLNNAVGTLKYYEGTITGGTEAIVGVINEVKENSDIVLTKVEEGEQAKLGNQDDIAYIDGKETHYNTLQSAIDACNGGETIFINKDITLVRTTTVENGKNITLNLNGKKILSFVTENTITNNGTLTIIDETEDEGKGQIIAYGSNILNNETEGTLTLKTDILSNNPTSCIENKGTLEINGGNINIENTASGSSSEYRNIYGIHNTESGTMTFKSGSININNTNGSNVKRYGIYNDGTGTIIMKEGNISETGSYTYGIYNNVEGKVNVEGGTISGEYGIYNNNSGTITIEGGDISSSNSAIYNKSTGTVEIREGSVISSSSTTISNGSTGTINITGSTITSNYYAISNSKGTVNISAGNISSTSTSSSAISNSSNGILTITGGTITSKGTSTSYGTISNSATATILGGTITSENGIGISNGRTLTIGNNEGEVNIDSPVITGKTYGVSNSGTFNFYDGVIKGETSAISGQISDKPYSYKLKYENSMKTATLELDSEFEGLIQVENIYYDKLSTAISVISNMDNKTGTIKICQDISNMSEEVTIPAGANITLALQGHTIEYKNTEVAITNSGILTIIDFEETDASSSSTTSTIKNANGTVIQNNGTLTIGQENNPNSESPVIEGQTAIGGSSATKRSGKLIGTIPDGMSAYRTSVMSLEDGGELVLSLEPETTPSEKDWTKENVGVGIQADIIPTLELYSTMDMPPLSSTKTAVVERRQVEGLEEESITESKLETEQVTAGDKIKYTIHVENKGEIEAQNVIVKDEVPQGTKVVEIGNDGEEVDGEITWTIPQIAVEGSAEVSFTVEVKYAQKDYTIENKATVEEAETNKTQNEYKKPQAQLTSELTKTGPETITSKEENVDYQIQFNAKINYFQGKAKVTLVDTLPLPIDEDNSDLGEEEYEYDPEKHTITWEEEIQDIDTFSNWQEHTITITKQISVKYDYTGIANIKEPIVNNVSSTIELLEEDEEIPDQTETVKTEEKTTQKETTIQIPAEVIVHHYIYNEEAERDEDKYTEVELVEKETKKGIVGESYTASPLSEIPANYTCVDPAEKTGTYGEEPIEVKYYYKLTKPTVENEIEKTVEANIVDEEGQAVLTKENGEVEYTIECDVKIKDYIGKATIEIVDTLPAEIDESKLEKDEGTYNPEDNTITWTQEIEDINTFTKTVGKVGDPQENIGEFEEDTYVVHITKQIKVVYTNQEGTEELVNKVKGTTKTYYPEKYIEEQAGQEFVTAEKQDEVTLKQDYRETDLKVKIRKTGTEEITSKGDKVNYKIDFNSEISNYTGEGRIEIVDTLPYEIDKNASKLAGGTYDEATNTITWEEEIKQINTDTGENKNETSIGEMQEGENGKVFAIGISKEIEVVYKDIDLTQEKMINTVKGKVELDETEETDEATASFETKINVEGKVIIRYVDKDTGKYITQEKQEIVGKVGSTYNAEIKEIEGYEYIDEGKATGTIEEGEKEIKLNYKKEETEPEVTEGTVTVKYQDKEGNKIEEDKIIKGKIGESYKTEEIEIENYKLVEVKGKEEGTIKEEETVVIYVYEKLETGKIVVRYVDQDTEKDIEKINPEDSTITNYTYEITGNIGEEYETEQKEIPYYIYVRSTENTKGTIKEGEDEVIYYYRKQKFNFSIEKTLEKVTVNGKEVKIKDNQLAKIEIKPSEIENTSIIADYKIKVTNEGELSGTVKVVDKLPEGYKALIVPDYWKENGDGTLEAEVELEIGESKELTVTLIWENSEENLGSKSNKAELKEGINEANYKDISKEDDKSEATIVISIKTGETVSIIILVMLTISYIISGYLMFAVAPRKGKEPSIKDIKFLNK